MIKFESNGVKYEVRWSHKVPVQWVSRDKILYRRGIGTRCTLTRRDESYNLCMVVSNSILHPKDTNYCKATGRFASFSRLMKMFDGKLAFAGWKAFWTAFPRSK